MVEEQKEKYSTFITEVSEILGLGKPVDIIKLCATTDLFFRPLEKRIAELEKENAELKGLKDVATLIRANNGTVITLMQLNNRLVSANQLINKLKKCDNCKENTTINPFCIDCENHSKWVLAD